ncbi:MAG: M56 family metallopeptidase [Acidobacteriota bacterium]|nr:M56 family metallopeptidase [Acidobacteriota bacterium]
MIFYCSTLLFFLWLIGIITGVGKVCREIWQFRLIRRNSRQVTFGELGCGGQLDFADAGRASLALAENISTPMLVGISRLVILLPADISEWTNSEGRRWIVEHELAHLSRRDNVVAAFQVSAGIIFFFHPLVRLALRRLSYERELACEEVIGHGADSLLYAENILKVIDRSFIFRVQICSSGLRIY